MQSFAEITFTFDLSLHKCEIRRISTHNVPLQPPAVAPGVIFRMFVFTMYMRNYGPALVWKWFIFQPFSMICSAWFWHRNHDTEELDLEFLCTCSHWFSAKSKGHHLAKIWKCQVMNHACSLNTLALRETSKALVPLSPFILDSVCPLQALAASESILTVIIYKIQKCFWLIATKEMAGFYMPNKLDVCCIIWAPN